MTCIIFSRINYDYKLLSEIITHKVKKFVNIKLELQSCHSVNTITLDA